MIFNVISYIYKIQPLNKLQNMLEQYCVRWCNKLVEPNARAKGENCLTYYTCSTPQLLSLFCVYEPYLIVWVTEQTIVPIKRNKENKIE
jgi:hypothetical protein